MFVCMSSAEAVNLDKSWRADDSDFQAKTPTRALIGEGMFGVFNASSLNICSVV